MQKIKSVITGDEIRPEQFEYVWQKFVLNRLESITREQETEDKNVEQVYIGYNHGFLDGIKFVLALDKIRS